MTIPVLTTFQPAVDGGRATDLKRSLFAAAIGAILTLMACGAAGLFIYFGLPSWIAPPEDVEISLACPTYVNSGDTFEVEVTINNLADRARVLDSIDVYNEFLAGVLIQRSTPPWQSSSHLFDEFVTYDFQLDIPPHTETVVLFHVRALQPGDYMGDWDVCIDGPASCDFEVLRTIISEQDAD